MTTPRLTTGVFIVPVRYATNLSKIVLTCLSSVLYYEYIPREDTAMTTAAKTFIIHINPSTKNAALVIYKVMGAPTIEQVTDWAYEGEHGLHTLQVSDFDTVKVEDASGKLIDPATVTGFLMA